MQLKKDSRVFLLALLATAYAQPLLAQQVEPAKPVPGTAVSTAPHPDTHFDKERFEKEVLRSKDLPNFHEVHPFLFRGGEPTELGLERLKAKGIKTVIDLRGGNQPPEERRIAERLGLKYINLPMSAEPPTNQQVKTFLDAVEAAENDPKQGSVFVHCAHGSDRTGCMVGIWRVTHDNYTYPQAYEEMRHYWFTPKFTKLSGTVEQYAEKSKKPTASTATSK